MANRKKKHHIIPKFYLEGFCDNSGMVTTYEKRNPNRSYKRLPVNTSIERNLYYEAYEDSLAEIIEYPASDSFKRLRLKLFPNFDDKQRLSLFFAVLMVRTPIYIKHHDTIITEIISDFARENASNKEKYHEQIKELKPNISEDEIEQMRVLQQSHEIKFTIDKKYLLYTILTTAYYIAQLLCDMKWVLLAINDENQFILSDNTFNIFNPVLPESNIYRPGLGQYGICVVFPLSSSLCLMMTNIRQFTNEHVYVNNELLEYEQGEMISLEYLCEEIVKLIFYQSHKYIYVSSESEKTRDLFKGFLKEKGKISN